MSVSKTRCQEIFEEVVEEFDFNDIPIADSVDMILHFNKTISALGCCKWKRINNKCYYAIYLSEYALEDEELIRNTIAHELVHTCPHCKNHGKYFKQYGAMVKTKLGYNIQTKAGEKEAKKSGIKDAITAKAKYYIKCCDCGQGFYRMKRSKVVAYPSEYRCGRCGGHLKVKTL